MRRLGIYVFYDDYGIVDDYIPYFLDDYVQNFEEFLIVCNGKLSEEGRKVFEKYTSKILLRENKGLDIGGYKDGMAYYGWEQLAEYDEVVLCNDTIMGPIYPFSEMFSEMEKRELDFWGMTRHDEAKDTNPYDCPYGYIPEHIQSYFTAFRKRFLQTKEFQTYWERMPYYENYTQVVGMHENVFTKYFADMGHRWDTYVDTSDFKNRYWTALMMYPMELLRDKRCPVFKKRVFFQDYEWVVNTSIGQHASELYNYLEKCTSYPLNLLLDNLIRTRHMVDLYRNLHWLYILPKHQRIRESVEVQNYDFKVGLIAFMHYPDMIDEMCQYLTKLPEFIDIFIFTNAKEKAIQIQAVCEKKGVHIKQIEIVPNRGRDMGCLLVEAKKFMFDYKYMGFVHDKKSKHIEVAAISEGFFYKCIENMLASEAYVYNVLDTFEKHEKLGILSPTEPNHSIFRHTIGNEWGSNYSQAKLLAEELQLTAPMSEEVVPLAPLGDYFWFRPEALRPLYRKNWTYSVLPKEPVDVDGTLLHAVERIYPYVAQTAGYYSGHILSDEFAAQECINLEYNMLGCVVDYVDLAKQERELYLNSTCWKITAPLRWIMDLLKGDLK